MLLDGNDDSMLIQDVYKIDKNSRRIDYQEYGRWNPIDGMQVQMKNIWLRRANMKGYQLK